MARTRFSRWRERHQREAVRSGHGLVSLGVPPPVPARTSRAGEVLPPEPEPLLPPDYAD